MSIKIKTTYTEVEDMCETFSKVAQATPGEYDVDEQDEDYNGPDTLIQFQKSMYSCGRNYNVAHAIITKVKARILKQKVDYEDSELTKYEDERMAINILHSETDSSGEAVTKVAPDGEERFSIPTSSRKALTDDIKDLDVKYEDAIKRIKDNQDDADNIMNDEVEIEIRTRPWKFAPKAITGAWLDKLTVMLTDVPELD